MRVRMRITVKKREDRAGELQTASDLRRDLWAHAPVEVDPDYPLHGIHRDADRRAYFEFATEYPEEVQRVVERYHYADRIEMTRSSVPPGQECIRCGNVAGPVQLPVCPNCGFQDISSCPICNTRSPRDWYTRLSGDLFRCPHCKTRVRLRFNNPMFLPGGGDFNQPLVLVEEAAAYHEVR